MDRERAYKENNGEMGEISIVKTARAFSPVSLCRRVSVVLSLALLLARIPAFGAQDDSVVSLREKIDRAERERLEVCRILGAIYEEIGDADKAIEVYRMGFQVYPDDPFLCGKLVRLYTVREAWSELVPIYESLANANPGANQSYLNDLAQCYIKAGQPGKALTVTGEMLDQYAENAALYRDAAQTFIKNECYEGAASICRKGIDGKFGDSADLHWILGQATAKLQQYEKAVPAYEKAIELSSAGRIRELIEKELAELCTHEPVVEQILANKLRSLRGIEQRLAELYWEKAVAAEQAGDLAEARTLYQKIALLVPDSDTGRAAEKKTQELGNP